MIDLKLLRMKKNRMTQQELADVSGVNRVTISAIENGKTPSIKVAKKFGDIFDIDWKCFYE